MTASPRPWRRRTLTHLRLEPRRGPWTATVMCRSPRRSPFENEPGTVVLSQPVVSTNTSFGSATAGSTTMTAQSFSAPGDLTQVRVALAKLSAPTDNVVLEIQTDSGGSPSGTVVGTVATIAGTSLSTSSAMASYSTSISLTASTTYWLVARRSGALDSTNRYTVDIGTATGALPVRKDFKSAAWSAGAEAFAVDLTFSTGSLTTLYLTDTASAVSTASVDREAWTSRGAGVQPT